VDLSFIPHLRQSCDAVECDSADLGWEGVAGAGGGGGRVPAIGCEGDVEEGEVEVDETLSAVLCQDPLENCIIFCGGGWEGRLGVYKMRILERQ
jgi:hypothetical protein